MSVGSREVREDTRGYARRVAYPTKVCGKGSLTSKSLRERGLIRQNFVEMPERGLVSAGKYLSNFPEIFVSNRQRSAAVSRGVREGLLRPLGAKVYTRNLQDPPELVVRRHLWQLVADLVPGALVADRTALEAVPGTDGSVFVVAARTRDIELPGLIVRPRPGAPPLASDRPFIGSLFLSSEARAYLDNMAPSRQRSGVARTLSRAELEASLERRLRTAGVEKLNEIRDQARRLAPSLGREAELAALDRLIGALLGTQDAPLATDQGKARRAGRPFDPERLPLFEALHRELRQNAPVSRPEPALTAEGRTTREFFEAYFSNYIEGTKFRVEEAADIVFRNLIPPARPDDAHDVVGTWRIVSDAGEMRATPGSLAELVALLRRRHANVMAARPDKRPGEFKTRDNQAGATLFVAHALVEGTLSRGFELYRSLESPFARAVFMMFLVSEVHPFTDGNGRVARVMMNAELSSASEVRILIPTVFRENYLMALKALSQRRDPSPLVRVLDFAQRWVAAIPWADLKATTAVLARCHAFMESSDADDAGVRLAFPS